MSMTRYVAGCGLGLALALGALAGDEPEGVIELKLALPNGDTYVRGPGSDPVAALVADITLVNKTPKEDLVKKKVTVTDVAQLTSEEFSKLREMTPEQQKQLLEKKKTTREIEVEPVNENSLGFAYRAPRLGPVDNVEFIITKLPEEGETVPEGAKPVTIPRDNLPDQATALDPVPNKYVAAGESSPAYTLPVGRYYVIRNPGQYSIKAAMPDIPDPKSPTGYAFSNEEKFRVLPFKSVDLRVEDLEKELSLYERGYPEFDYMLYQVRAEAGYDEIYALQRVHILGVDHWEWNRVCSVKVGTSPLVIQLSPKKVKIGAALAKGDAGIYTIDFSTPGVKIEAETKPMKDGQKLKNEGGNISVE
ncbi:MAG TPA: hypothetical protein VKX17_06670 [Planctomycetota bacterium]|nr:hypothetical protein [Planctomycetota bacterium]